MFRRTKIRSGMVLCLGVLALAPVAKAGASPPAPESRLKTADELTRPLTPRMHQAPLPSAALAGVALLSITAAHGFGRRRRRR